MAMDFNLLVRSLLKRNERAGDLPWAQPKNARGLAKLLAGKVAERSVYEFLDGKNVRTSTLVAILEAMEIELRVSLRYDGSRWIFRPGLDPAIDQNKIKKHQLWKEVERLSSYSPIDAAIKVIDKQYEVTKPDVPGDSKLSERSDKL